MLWLGLLCGALGVAVAALLIRVALMQRAADEIAEQFARKLEEETNTLIVLSTGDRHMRRLAGDINAQLRRLNRERHRFRQGDAELREAMTNISHDLRTPLTAICGYLDLLEREGAAGDVPRYTRMIRNRTDALIRLTEELFRYSVIASAARDVQLESVSLHSALEESLSAHYAALKERGIEPEISMPEGAVVRRLDADALSRILGNILGNAIRYSDGDLAVTLKEDGAILFSNRASGLNAVDVGRLFDRFFTVETGRKGAGLGLSIAKLLTEQMGGRIAADYKGGRLMITLIFQENANAAPASGSRMGD